MYRRRYNCLETLRIVMSAITSSGILAAIFIQGYLIKVAAAIVSLISLIINSYFKVYDLNGLIETHKKSARELIKIREKFITLLCDIKMNRVTEEQIIERRDELLNVLMCTYDDTKDASDKAVTRASENLKTRRDNTYSDDEIDSFLPVYLRNTSQQGDVQQ